MATWQVRAEYRGHRDRVSALAFAPDGRLFSGSLDTTVLAWARQRWACVVFNLHVDHSPEGIETAAGHFRRLIDRATELGGSYYLTYHRWATAAQALACHPRLGEFIAEKRRFDANGVFTSDWFTHHERLLAPSE